MRHHLLVAFLLLAVMPANLAHAAADEDSDDTNQVRNCASGEVWDRRQRECVNANEQSLNDSDFLRNGRALAYLGRFGEAVAILSMVKDKNRPDVLNYLGYATRNAGDLQAGIAYYRQAIALDPNYTLARSYMGQALLLNGDRDGAIAQLDEIEERCGRDCAEYIELAEALVASDQGETFRY